VISSLHLFTTLYWQISEKYCRWYVGRTSWSLLFTHHLFVEHKGHNILEKSYPSLSVQSWFASVIKIKLRVLIQQKSLQNEQHRTRSHYALLKKKVGGIAQPIPFQQQPVTPLLNLWSNLGHPEKVPAKGTNHFTILKLVVQIRIRLWDM